MESPTTGHTSPGQKFRHAKVHLTSSDDAERFSEQEVRFTWPAWRSN